jgi:hypothetical protein
MKRATIHFCNFLALTVMALMAAGCATNGDKTGGGAHSSRATTDDGRKIDIGRATPAPGGGMNYRNPHIEKCWVADGFNFNGYDTLYIAPTLSTANFPTNKPEDVMVHDLAKENLVHELVREIRSRKIFTNIVTRESDIQPGAKTLKLENTITEFNKGGGAARYFAGLYGGGQPVLRVAGRLTEAEKPVFIYEARRSGVSAGARMSGVFMKDEDIQIQDIRSLVLDLADFMSVTAGKFARR